MSIELIIAPPATGKTETCLQRIQSLRKDHPIAKVWVIVPDRLQAAAFRRRLAANGGALGVKVGRFPDLLKTFLEKAGTFHPLASIPLINRLIREVVNTAVSEGSIPYYAPLQPFPGFILSLRDSFAELKRGMVTPSKFAEFTKSGSLAQTDLASLYARYQEKLETLSWADAEDITLQAIKIIEQNATIAEAIDLLVVDGFDSFNLSQHALLKGLTTRVKRVIVTIPGVRASVRQAHHRFNDSIERLIDELSPEITTIDNPPSLPPPLARIEKYLFDSLISAPISTPVPLLLEARSPTEEAREAIRWIKKMVIREKIPLSACAIFTPNPSAYHSLLRASAEEAGVPIRFTLDDSLEQSPAITSLINLLSLPGRKYSSRYLLNSLRSPYFDFNLEDETIDTYERVSRVGQIVEGRDQWEEVWERLAASSPLERFNLDDERNAPSLPRGEDAVVLGRVMRGIFDLVTPHAESLTLKAWINWLEDLLEHLHFYELTDNERDRSAVETLQELLRAFLVSEIAAGEKQATYDQFFADLQAGIAGEGYREKDVIGQPALLVGRFTEARGTRFQAVALLGLSEGSLPVNEHPDPFLDEDLRGNLGLELKLQREQAGLFYQAVTRADKQLLITRPYLSDDGEKWEESAYWKAVSSLFDSSAIVHVNPEFQQLLTETASNSELLFSAVRRRSLPQKYDFLIERWHDLQLAQTVLKARRAAIADGEYEGVVPNLSPVFNQMYSPESVWSSSRLESYGNCPFQFFVANSLELDTRDLPKLGLDAATLGSLLHRVLELTFRSAINPKDLESLMVVLREQSRAIFENAPHEFSFRASPLWEVEKEQYLQALEESVSSLWEKSEGWTPLVFEQKFGIGNNPPLGVTIGDEAIYIHGLIDRVDRNSVGQLRIIDYKTGGAHMAAKDLTDGNRLQLPIYALATRDALHIGDPVDGFYWKILAGEASSLKLAKFSAMDMEGIEAAYAVLRNHLLRIVQGIRAGEFAPKRPEGGCPSYCVAAQWCWRYEAGR